MSALELWQEIWERGFYLELLCPQMSPELATGLAHLPVPWLTLQDV